jgi:hypothetical protein
MRREFFKGGIKKEEVRIMTEERERLKEESGTRRRKVRRKN